MYDIHAVMRYTSVVHHSRSEITTIIKKWHDKQTTTNRYITLQLLHAVIMTTDNMKVYTLQMAAC